MKRFQYPYQACLEMIMGLLIYGVSVKATLFLYS